MELSEAQKYSKAIKSVFSTILKSELYALLAVSPLTKIPIIGWLIKSFLFSKLDQALESGRLTLFFKFIDMRSGDQNNEYTKAVFDWEEAKKKGDENEIERTKKVMLAKFDSFVRFNSV